MNKILSWKITGGVYAYIYPVNNGKYISNRIAEDSPIWQSVISEISNWDLLTYQENFRHMADEVQTQYGYTIAWDDKFFNFVDENAVGGVNIVLLSGKDGDGIGGDGSGFGNGPGAEIIEEFNEMLQSKLDAVRGDIEKQNEEVKNFVEDKVSETISKAQSTINETKQELNTIKDELTSNLKSAQDALDKASALFDFEGEITSEDIVNALSSVKEYGGWLEEYSGSVKSLQTDYDEAKGLLGSIGESESVVDGLFSQFATSLNVISGTVGNVERSMNASEGMIEDFASWYDENASAVTEMSRFMSASAAVISDVVKYIDSDEFGNEITSKLEESMDAKNAEIKNEIMTETSSAITNVTNIMNGLSGVVETNITRMDTISGNLTAMGDKMNAMSGTMEEYMTQFNEVSGIAIDLRDSWSAESGKLSTVASLVAETDDEGNIRYFVSSATVNGEEEILAEEIEVRKILNDDGTHYFKPIEGQGGTLSNHIWTEAYMKMSQEMGSYIQQGISSITMSVVGGENLTAAIKLAISGDSALIGLIANEVVIDATTIIKEIQSIKGIIGGIVMEDGLCYSMTKGTYNNGVPNPYFLLDGTNGKIYAENAEIKGSISADTGYIGGLEMGDNMLKAIDVKKETRYYVIDPESYNGSRLEFEFGDYITYDEVVAKHYDKKIFAVSYKDKNGKKNKLTISNVSNAKSYYEFTTDDNFSTDEFGILSVDFINNFEIGNKQTYALISSSDEYEDDDKGKLVIGVGPTDSGCGINYYYKYILKTDETQTERIQIETIYLKKHYSLENGDKKDIYVDAYFKNNGVLTEITGYTFQYSYETFTESGEGIKSGYSPVHGENVYYKDWIYAKSIASSILDGLNYSVPSPYSSNDEMVLGLIDNEASVNHRVQMDFDILAKDDVGGGGTGGSGSSGSGSGGSGSNTGVTNTGDKGSLTVDVGGNVVSYPYMGTNKFDIMDNPTRVRFWDGNLRSDAIIRSVMIVGTYDYSGECIIVDTTDFNTKIYEDGTLVTKNIMSEDGFFGGEINSTGTFSGELKDATGTLKNVSITADTINTSLVVSDGKSINAISESNAYFRVNDNEVASGAESETWTIDSFTWDKQNKNGKNAGITYTEEKILLKTTIQNSAKVTIPSMSGYIKRYAPRKKTNNRGSVYVNAYFLSDDNVTTRIFNTMIDVPAFKGSGSKNIEFTTPSSTITYTNTKSGYLIVEFGMQIHLSTYSWLGADKAAGHVYFNTNTSKVDIKYENRNKDGVHIGKNGMRAEGNLYLYSPNGQYGIEITDSGVKIIKNGISSDL